MGRGDEPLDDYVAFCFDEAVLIAGRAHERRMQAEAAAEASSGTETPMNPQNIGDAKGGGFSLTPHSDKRAKTALESQYPNQVVMSTSGELTSGVIPFIGRSDS